MNKHYSTVEYMKIRSGVSRLIYKSRKGPMSNDELHKRAIDGVMFCVLSLLLTRSPRRRST
jgi:hypothetical protein